MTTDQTDRKALAEHYLSRAHDTLQRHDKPLGVGSALGIAQVEYLAAIHDEQQAQTALLRDLPYAIVKAADEYAARAEGLLDKGDPCPCGCRRDVEPKPHVHFWKRQQNVTSRGYAMDPIEVCECGVARKADPEPESVTVTLLNPPGMPETWRSYADHADKQGCLHEVGDMLRNVADALDAANRGQS